MNSPSIIIRDARPDLKEGLVCARYLNEAAEGFIRIMFGPGFAEIVANAFIQSDNEYSFENVIFAERDGVIVGMALGYTAEKHRGFSGEVLKNAAGKHALRVKVIQRIFSPMIRIINTIADSDFYVLSAAVDEELRGEGVGTRLIDSMEDRAMAYGSTRLALDVAASNKGARRLYERRGMTIESQWPKRFPMPGIRFFRMTKRL